MNILRNRFWIVTASLTWIAAGMIFFISPSYQYKPLIVTIMAFILVALYSVLHFTKHTLPSERNGFVYPLSAILWLITGVLWLTVY